MKYSIIIPVYNSEKCIDRCLNSVLNQTYIDFEVLIVDDGSNDRTEEICNRFVLKDARIKYFHQNNNGVSSARNLGIDKSSGSYLLFLDSDDAYDTNYVKEFDIAISKHPNADNIWCGYKNTNTNGNSINNLLDLGSEYVFDSRSKINIFRQKSFDAPLWNKAFKSDIIKHNKISMREDLSLGEDLLFNYEYLDLSAPEIVFINKPLYIYSVPNGRSLDSKFRLDLNNIYHILNGEIYKYLKKWDTDDKTIKDFYNNVFYLQERVLRNTYHKDSTLTNSERIKFNNEILKSHYFQEAINNSTCYIHPLYRIAYKCKSWRLIQFVDKLVSIKNKFSNNTV